MNRREALRKFSLFLAASPLARAQEIIQYDLPYTPERSPSIDELVNVFEFEPICKQRIPKQNYDFIAGGVDNEWTLRRNREAFGRITVHPRMLVDTSKIDLSTTLFGRKLEMPILVAPTAAHQLAHPDGELATVRAASKVKSCMVVSTNSSYPIQKICEAGVQVAGEAPWFQLYAGPDREGTRERVENAVASGCKLICWTVDGQYQSHRERILRNRVRPDVGASARARVRRRGTEETPSPAPYKLQPTLVAQLDWKFLAELKSYTKVPVLVKGILTAEDAKLAVEHGADGIVVSNHGGRYLESAPSTIEVLPGIVDAVGGKFPILIDSGFRRGTDILKALAIGAKAVLLGRPVLWGLGAFGQPGVERVLELLQTELALAMGLSGKPNLDSIDRSLVKIS